MDSIAKNMCVIIKLPPGTVLSEGKLRNAILNNPDGWGIVFVDRGQLTLRKECDPEGNDPELIAKILTDSRDVQRYLHVRKNTVGKTIIDNTHPFTVLSVEGGRRIEFMHNGTFHTYKATTPEGQSDTRHYAETFLSPLLNKFHGDNGIGDYTDTLLSKILSGVFDYNNRGLLISNDLEARSYGKWDTVKDGDVTFEVSNNDYFDRLITTRVPTKYLETLPTQQRPVGGSPAQQGQMFRGSEPEEEAKAPTANRLPSSYATPQVIPLKDINLQKSNSILANASDLNDLMDLSIREWEDLDNEQIVYFQYCTRKEIQAWLELHPSTASMLYEAMFVRFAELVEEYDTMDEARVQAVLKHEAATKHIADLVAENNELKKALGEDTKEVKAA